MNTPSGWSVIAVSEQVNDEKPLAAYADGYEFAVFRDAAGVARVVENRCPHRRVPLALGKVVGGAIRCAYHGWTFDGASGSCIAVPNLGKDERVSPNYCVKAYACREQGGFVYAWVGEDEPASTLVFDEEEPLQEPDIQRSGNGIVPLEIGHYRDALIDGPQALLGFAGVRITDFFLGDAVMENGRVIIDREAEWGDADAPPAIKITDRPLVLRTELLTVENCAVFRLFDDKESLLAQIQLAFASAPRGSTAFCWRFRRYPAFRAAQPLGVRLRYGRGEPATVYSKVDGRSVATLLVGPSFDFHKLISPAGAS